MMAMIFYLFGTVIRFLRIGIPIYAAYPRAAATIA